MYNVLAYNPNTRNTVIVENFIEKKNKLSSLQWWKDNGMSFVKYTCKQAMLIQENLPSNKVSKERRDCK